MSLSRAQGCLLGQLTGDALGSQVEFQSAKEIEINYPEGVRFLANGGTWGTLAGQPTDDSEMALILARAIVKNGAYNSTEVLKGYQFWLQSKPFDIGQTVASGLNGQPNLDSQANGAMMRVSPLGIFGAHKPEADLIAWAKADAALTHPNRLCQEANALYALAIAQAIRLGPDPQTLYQSVARWAEDWVVDPDLLEAVKKAKDYPPLQYSRQQGWVLIAFQNALWQLLYAANFEEALVDTVERGGDTDTNGAICGALLGAVYGLETIPAQWREKVLNCRPQSGQPGVRRPRPEVFWPVDALELAAQLLGES
ncbi:MAG: ADP-ribosylglycohydrolase family protein [Deltaproteobacteria bacterium]|jgi:ADP-ribosylglycohydrolase|nr:ADP-ribosylglycohydrolase family protein [Deltaproteobacteria bacterium]